MELHVALVLVVVAVAIVLLALFVAAEIRSAIRMRKFPWQKDRRLK